MRGSVRKRPLDGVTPTGPSLQSGAASRLAFFPLRFLVWRTDLCRPMALGSGGRPLSLQERLRGAALRPLRRRPPRLPGLPAVSVPRGRHRRPADLRHALPLQGQRRGSALRRLPAGLLRPAGRQRRRLHGLLLFRPQRPLPVGRPRHRQGDYPRLG